MTGNRPHLPQVRTDAADMGALDARFAAEDRADLQDEVQRRRLGLPDPGRNLRVFDGFADTPTTERTGA